MGGRQGLIKGFVRGHLHIVRSVTMCAEIAGAKQEFNIVMLFPRIH